MTVRADIAEQVIVKVDAYLVQHYGQDALNGRPTLRLVVRVAAMVASLTLDVRERMQVAK